MRREMKGGMRQGNRATTARDRRKRRGEEESEEEGRARTAR
jgi:hypothetical protein